MDQNEVDALRSALAAVLRAERARVHLTQDDVVERSGLSKSTIVRLEAGKRDADLVQLAAYAEALGVHLSYLVREVESSQRGPITPGANAVLDRLAATATERDRKGNEVTLRSKRMGDRDTNA